MDLTQCGCWPCSWKASRTSQTQPESALKCKETMCAPLYPSCTWKGFWNVTTYFIIRRGSWNRFAIYCIPRLHSTLTVQFCPCLFKNKSHFIQWNLLQGHLYRMRIVAQKYKPTKDVKQKLDKICLWFLAVFKAAEGSLKEKLFLCFEVISRGCSSNRDHLCEYGCITACLLELLQMFWEALME